MAKFPEAIQRVYALVMDALPDAVGGPISFRVEALGMTLPAVAAVMTSWSMEFALTSPVCAVPPLKLTVVATPLMPGLLSFEEPAMLVTYPYFTELLLEVVVRTANPPPRRVEPVAT
jgi:hypothetical protein